MKRQLFNYFLFLGVWPFNENAMADKVSSSTLSTSSNSMAINKPPSNILLPQSSPSCDNPSNNSSFMDLSASTFITSSERSSTNTSINYNTTFDPNLINTTEQILAEVPDIEPIQPTIFEGDDVSLPNDSIYTTLQPVEFNTSISHFQSIHDTEKVQNFNQESLSMPSIGKKFYTCVTNILILFSFRGKSTTKKTQIFS
jgi:hypothetical protein